LRKKRKLLIGSTEIEMSGISIDSRCVQVGDVFFALRGTVNDGHQFISDALIKGAAAVVIDDKAFYISDKTILVDNVLESLKEIGLKFKNLANPKATIGITGSVGKTTTKVWISEILKNHHYRVFTTTNNYNTIFGLSLALSTMEDDPEFCVLEMGSNHPGEILELSKYLSPNIGIITNIFESHIGNFKDKMEIAKEKISILDGMPSGSVLIFNGDSEFFEDIKRAADDKQIRTMSVGFSDHCDYKVISGQKLTTIQSPSMEYRYEPGICGKHYDYIGGCLIATLDALGLQIEHFLQYFSMLCPLPGRGQVLNCNFHGKQFKIVDESYNASPTAVLAALEVFDETYDFPKVAIIGQMNELGDHEEFYHRRIAQSIADCHLHRIFFIGAERLWKVFEEVNAKCYPELSLHNIHAILETITDGSRILLKGSHSIGLVRLIQAIQGHYTRKIS
jgi:UDP-N-acetylmuramoyl-tripeptide--D-alanyl-D-alanine ligase